MADRSVAGRWLRRLVIYPAEAALVYPLYAVFALLPVDMASGFGGWLGRSIGPWLPVTRRAFANLRRALPDLPPERHRAIVCGMWDNLGRMMAEHPHLERLWAEADMGRIAVVGAEHLPRPDDGARQPSLIVGGHLGNWEMLPASAGRFGVAPTSVYRRPNNPLIAPLMTAGRRIGQGRLVPKGREGARAIVATLAAGGMVAMLIDQKMNDGMAVPFFGLPAMTAPAAAQLALKFHGLVLPTRIERLEGARFRMVVEPPLVLVETGNREADVRALMVRLNERLESWIRARPEQWLWLHRRWPD